MMMRRMNEFSILITGIGGQGVILLSNVLGRAAIYEGCKAIASETHGMAQRGGSVESHVRLYGKIDEHDEDEPIHTPPGPLIPLRKADLMIALEPLEGVRVSRYLSENSVVVMNTSTISPLSVLRGEEEMPSIDELVNRLKKVTERVVCVNALEIATSISEPRSANIFLLGVASRYIPLSESSLRKGIEMSVPEKALDVNMKAFDRGVMCVLG